MAWYPSGSIRRIGLVLAVLKFKVYGIVSPRRDAQTLLYRLTDKPEVKRLRRLSLEGIEGPS